MQCENIPTQTIHKRATSEGKCTKDSANAFVAVATVFMATWPIMHQSKLRIILIVVRLGPREEGLSVLLAVAPGSTLLVVCAHPLDTHLRWP